MAIISDTMRNHEYFLLQNSTLLVFSSLALLSKLYNLSPITYLLPMHLLLVEDDQGIITPLKIYLEQSGHTVAVCSDGLIALDTYAREKPALVILDINLPGKNGVEICREIRAIAKTPIIVLSARESEDDKVALLELGADDYVAKPFSPRELVARIAAVAKRAEEKKEIKTGKNLCLRNIEVDTKSHIATLSGEELKLTKTEFSILEYLIRNMK